MKAITVKNGGRYSENIEEISTRTMTLFYIFDKSLSMDGTKIAQVNYAMKDIPKIIKSISDDAPNANISVCAAAFDSKVEWITAEPQSPEEFINIWKDIKVDRETGFRTRMGAALASLDEKLSRSSFLGDNPMGYLAPGIIFLSDGCPTDIHEWKAALEKIRKNAWFEAAIKIAFAIGEDADKSVLAEICGSPEAVISIDDPEKIRECIDLVTVHVSRTGTRGTVDQEKSAQEEVIDKLKRADDDTPVVVDIPKVDDDQF